MKNTEEKQDFDYTPGVDIADSIGLIVIMALVVLVMVL